MGNAETLQRNNTRISENNTDLSSILDTVNNLPKAGAGFEINDCSYLFYYGARMEQFEEILTLCKNVTNATNMFRYCPTTYKSLDLSGFDASKISIMSFMFANSNFSTINLSNFNTFNATTMAGMFNSCQKLTELDISSFDTSNVSSMNAMFDTCRILTKLDLSSFDTSNVTNMANMFYRCSKLTNLDLSSFNTNNVTTMTYMFNDCTSLEKLDLRNFNFDKVTSHNDVFKNVPANCEIIVKGDTEKEWVLARRNDLTNVKTVSELEV